MQSRCQLNEVAQGWQSYKNTRASPSMDVYHVLPEHVLPEQARLNLLE